MPEAQFPTTWTADNGNGTFSNPLFFDEFSDPDMIRVGSDYYLTGTTMHTSPGLPVLHSKDLVNWTLLSYWNKAARTAYICMRDHFYDCPDRERVGFWGMALQS